MSRTERPEAPESSRPPAVGHFQAGQLVPEALDGRRNVGHVSNAQTSLQRSDLVCVIQG